MWKNRENIAKLFFVIFIFSIIISFSFMVFHLDHECISEDCNVCYEMNLLKSIFDNLLILSLMYVFVKKSIFLPSSDKKINIYNRILYINIFFSARCFL